MTENYTGLEEAFNRLLEDDNYNRNVGSAMDNYAMFLDDTSAKLGNQDIIFRLERRVNQGGGVATAWLF